MEITPFDYSGKTIRIITDEDGNPWWVASDVCAVLGIKNSPHAINRMDNDEKSTIVLSDSGPPRNIISEPGLYRLLSKSKKKRAKRFQRWVFHDVLPEIRKTGGYNKPALPQTYKEALQHLLVQVEKNEKLLAENSELKPKAKVYDLVSASTGLVCISDAAKILQIPPHTFRAYLARDRYIFERRGKWVPYAPYEQRGWFQVKLVPARDRSGHTYRQTFITPKGVQEFRKKYNPDQQQRRLFA